MTEVEIDRQRIENQQAAYYLAETQTEGTRAAFDITCTPMQMTKQAQADADATATFYPLEATLQQRVVQKRIDDMNIERDRKLVTNSAIFFGSIGFCFIGVGVMVVLLRRPAPVPVEDDEEDDYQPEPPVTVQLDELNGGYVGATQFTIPRYIAERHQLLILADGLLEKKLSLSYENWTPSEKGFSRGKFESLIYLLIKNGLAKYADENDNTKGVVLTDAGKRFFEAILAPTL